MDSVRAFYNRGTIPNRPLPPPVSDSLITAEERQRYQCDIIFHSMVTLFLHENNFMETARYIRGMDYRWSDIFAAFRLARKVKLIEHNDD